MRVEDICAVLGARIELLDLFELEQRLRGGSRELAAFADLLVVQREAISRDGARAFLQRIGRASGPVWLEALLPEAIVGQPLWGHEGAVQWMRVEAERLMTRSKSGRLRCFDRDGRCTLDRPARARDDARWLDEALVFLHAFTVRVCDPDTGEELVCIELDRGDDYRWLEEARLLDDASVALRYGEDYPGSLYGPQYEWFRLDPRAGSQTRMKAPEQTLRFAGRTVVALAGGSLRLVDDPAELVVEPVHARGVRQIGFGPTWMVSAGDEGLQLYDREGSPLGRGKTWQHDLREWVVTPERVIVLCNSGSSGSSRKPRAQVWKIGEDTVEPGEMLEAGGRYGDFISCDPTGTRVAYTLDGVLHVREIGRAEALATPLTWHWNRRHAWSRDGARFAIQHRSKAPTVWSLATGERERILSTDVLDSGHVGVTEQGDMVLADHSFYQLRAISIDDGVEHKGIRPGFNLSCVAGSGSKGVCGGVEGGYWFDRSTGERRCHQKGPWIYACDIQAGRAALAGSEGVHAIDLDSGALRWHWADEGCGDQVQVVVLEHSIVALGQDGWLTSLRDGQVLARFDAFPGLPQAQSREGGSGFSLCRLPDSTVLVAGRGAVIRQWDPERGVVLREYALGGSSVGSLSTGGGKLLFESWKTKASCCWKMIALEDGAALELPEGPQRPRLTPDGQRLISFDTVARLDLLDAHTGAILEHRRFGSWPCFERLEFVNEELCGFETNTKLLVDGDLALRSYEDGRLEVLRDGECVACWVDSRKWTCAAIRADRIAAGDAAGNIAVWALREAHSDA